MMIKVHDSHNQFNFKSKDFFKTENYQFYRSNKFAKVCGVNRTTLENVYSGLNTISLTTLEQIADGLGCKPSDLILDWDGELERV